METQITETEFAMNRGLSFGIVRQPTTGTAAARNEKGANLAAMGFPAAKISIPATGAEHTVNPAQTAAIPRRSNRPA